MTFDGENNVAAGETDGHVVMGGAIIQQLLGHFSMVVLVPLNCSVAKLPMSVSSIEK